MFKRAIIFMIQRYKFDRENSIKIFLNQYILRSKAITM